MMSTGKGNWIGYFMVCLLSLVSPLNGYRMLENVKNVHDLCRTNRHMYEIAENSNFLLVLQSKAPSESNDKLLLKKVKTKCTLMIKVCSSCHISVFIRNMSIPSCSDDCSCSHFEIGEPLSDFRSQKYCGEHEAEVLYFESKTKIIHFDFVQSVHEKFYVTLNFTVGRNVFFYTEDFSSLPKFVETPYFPSGYPSDYEAEYNFQVSNPVGYIQLLFVDFHLSRDSSVEITGHNGTQVEVFNGKNFRPPAIVSQGLYLRVIFKANDQPSSLGFRAMYNFGLNIGDYPLVKLHTNCGGKKDESGGVIELTVPQVRETLFDCIWLIPPPLFVQQSVFLSASVLEFKDIGPGSSLEFRQGLTSKSNVIKFHHCRSFMNCSSEIEDSEVVAQAESGFYVRFRGYVKKGSSLLISYCAFKQNNCSGNDFSCNNGRCISSLLVCDGYTHCPSGSDEAHCPDTANKTSMEGKESNDRGEVKTETPVIAKYTAVNDNTTFLMFIVVGSCGVMTVILIFAYSSYHRYKFHRRVASRALAAAAARRNTATVTPTSVDNAGSLQLPDCPPSYEDVVSCSDRYPRLHYTKKRGSMETCFNSEFCRAMDMPKDAASHQSEVETQESAVDSIPSVNAELVANMNCGTTPVRVRRAEVGGATKKVRSLSLDFVSGKLSTCSDDCPHSVASLLPSGESLSSIENISYNSLPSDFRVPLHRVDSSNNRCESCCTSSKGCGNRSYSYSFLSDFAVHPDVVQFPRNSNSPCPSRKKTYSV